MKLRKTHGWKGNTWDKQRRNYGRKGLILRMLEKQEEIMEAEEHKTDEGKG